MPVERRGPPHDGHDAVGQRKLEETLDVLVRHPLRQHAKRELRAQLGVEMLAPATLVRGERLSPEIALRERIGQHIRGQRRAQQAVVDATAGRRFDQPRGIPTTSSRCP